MGSGSGEVVAKMFGDVLEKQAFVFADSVEKEELSAPGACAEVCVSFKGSVCGRLRLLCPPTLGAVLAANVLGTEPEDEEAIRQQEDTLKEIVNMTCGAILTNLVGTGPVFDLAAPVVRPVSVEDWNQMAADASSVALNVEDQPVLLCFSTEG